MTHTSQTADSKALLAQALLEIRRLRQQVEASERARREPIAIVGIGCRFPGNATSPEAFWRLLASGVDAVTEIPPDRWEVDRLGRPPPDRATSATAVTTATTATIATTATNRWGAFIEDIQGFDAEFFGISPREARQMDPQQRVLLEVACEALDSAGIAPGRIASTAAGVFVGVSSNDYQQRVLARPGDADAYTTTGNLNGVMCGRLSFHWDLQGPCLAVDTGCSSSLVAVHLACQSLRNGECDLALAGGVNAILSPEVNVAASRLQAFSPDGRCRTFDARANGYVRGEGCGVIVLKRWSDARASGDRVWAVIRGSAVMQDGRSTGLTTPNVLAQQAVLRRALSNAEVTPDRIGFVETHGTGTPLGDPIEFEALRDVYGAGEHRCALGAVKTNIGHLEAAAGIAGLVKAVLSLYKGEIPANLNFTAANPRLRMERTRFVVPTKLQPWTGSTPRCAAVSSFGIGGTNAHLVLEQAPGDESVLEKAEVAEGQENALLLSACSAEALRALVSAYVDWLGGPGSDFDRPGSGSQVGPMKPALEPMPDLSDICWTAAVRREHYEYRCAVVGETRAEIVGGMLQWLRDSSTDEAVSSVSSVSSRCASGRPKVVFVFPGQGSQWAGMGRELMARETVFREAMERCDAAIRDQFGWSVVEQITEAEGISRLDQLDIVQPSLFAMQVGLSALWRSWGIEPDALLGHSMGEVAAAHVSGALTLEQAVRVIGLRSALVKESRGSGSMAVVELAADVLEPELAETAGRVSVAACNGPHTTVLAGDRTALERVVSRLESKGTFCRWVKVDFASHSPQMDPVMEMLEPALGALASGPCRISMFSTVYGRTVSEGELGARYWCENLRRTVLFWQGVQDLSRSGHGVFLEISPHPVLLSALEQGLKELNPNALAVGSLRRERPGRSCLLSSAASLHVRGCAVAWDRVLRPGRCVSLPPYPWQHAHYWVERVRGATLEGREHAMLGTALRSSPNSDTHRFEFTVGANSVDYLEDHRVLGSLVIPGAAQLDLALAAAEELYGHGQAVLEQIQFRRVWVVPDQGTVAARIEILTTDSPNLATFRISSSQGQTEPSDAWVVHSCGNVRIGTAPREADRRALEELRGRCTNTVSKGEYYSVLRGAGLELGPRFQGFTSLDRSETEALGRIELDQAVAPELDRYRIHPALLDICFQAIGGPATLHGLSVASGNTWLPVELERLSLYGSPRGNEPLFSHVVMRDLEPNRRGYRGDLELLRQDGTVILKATGLRIASVGADRAEISTLDQNWLYRLVWTESGPLRDSSSAREGPWLVLGDQGELSRRISARLASRGIACMGAAPPGGPVPAGILYLAGAQRGNPELCGEQVLEMALADSVAVLETIQHVAKAGWRDAPRLVLATREAQRVRDQDCCVTLAQSPLWGLGRVVRHEHPELRCASVDLSAEPSDAEVERLVDYLLVGDRDDQVAFREDSRFGLRLQPASWAHADPKAFRLDRQGQYLIVGGMGGLGLQLARWMAERGAGRVVLVGRSAPSSTVQAMAQELSRDGTELSAIRCDVSHSGDVADLFRKLASAPMPLRGIVHSAVVLDDGILMTSTKDKFWTVFGPKVAGAWNLHRAASHLSLDFFVLFSSMASVLGSPGQGNYAAANAFLDALSDYREQHGMPTLSINWGPWSVVGQAASSAHGARVAERGVGSMTPEQALDQFATLLSDRSHARVAVAPLDLRLWREFYPAMAASPCMASLMQSVASASVRPSGLSSVRQHLLAAEPRQRRELLIAHLRDQVGRVLQMPPGRIGLDKPFSALGVDSLMGLEIRNRLETSLSIKLPAILVYAHPTLGALASHLLEKLEDDGTEGGVVTSGHGEKSEEQVQGEVATPSTLDIEAMSEGQAEQALLDRLAALAAGGKV